jgi:hypothetical protein
MTRYTLLAVVVALSAAGCRGPHLAAPETYLRLEKPGYLYADRVVSADGVSIAVRRPEPARDGTLDFWAKAVGNKLTSGGYLPAGEADQVSADGLKGRRMDFSYTAGSNEFAYTVIVWVDGGNVFVAEAGGPKAAFDADRPKIEASLASINLR